MEEEWEGKSHLPKKELIQTTGSMEGDSVADDKKVGRQVKAGLKSGWVREREELYFLSLLTCTYADERKTSTWVGLGLICQKIRRLWITRSSLLGSGALLGSMFGVELPAYRESELKPPSKTSFLGSMVLFTAEVARQGHKKEVVILLLKILSFWLITIAVLRLLYATVLKPSLLLVLLNIF